MTVHDRSISHTLIVGTIGSENNTTDRALSDELILVENVMADGQTFTRARVLIGSFSSGITVTQAIIDNLTGKSVINQLTITSAFTVTNDESDTLSHVLTVTSAFTASKTLSKTLTQTLTIGESLMYLRNWP